MEPYKPCHVGIYWVANRVLSDLYPRSRVQSFFSFLDNSILAKLATRNASLSI